MDEFYWHYFCMQKQTLKIVYSMIPTLICGVGGQESSSFQWWRQAWLRRRKEAVLWQYAGATTRAVCLNLSGGHGSVFLGKIHWTIYTYGFCMYYISIQYYQSSFLCIILFSWCAMLSPSLTSLLTVWEEYTWSLSLLIPRILSPLWSGLCPTTLKVLLPKSPMTS